VLREAIATGDTVEIAFANACKELGVETAEMEVLAMPVKKTLGLFGGSPAKVRAYIKPSAAEIAAEYLKKILSGMGLQNVSVEIKEEENGAELTLDGDDIGFIIGHRGETLDALQYLASLVANQKEESYYRVTLDVGSFREKRKETLENLGKRMAARAVKSGRNQSLEPMNPYERRIIHTAVQTVEGAKSWSEGEDLARHVVIGPVDGERVQKYSGRGGRYGGHGKGGRRPERKEEKKPKTISRISETADLPFSPAPLDPTPAPKKMEDAPLYGRIERYK
jgi:spoIIIJ-associated protein